MRRTRGKGQWTTAEGGTYARMEPEEGRHKKSAGQEALAAMGSMVPSI